MYGHLKLVYKVLNQTMSYRIALNLTMHIQILSLVSNDCTHTHTHAHTHTHTQTTMTINQICIHDVSNANC
jgi:hypothetical protein